MASAVTTDRALGLTDMYRIANTLKGVTADDVVMRTVPGTIQNIDGQSFVVHEPGATDRPVRRDAQRRGARGHRASTPRTSSGPRTCACSSSTASGSRGWPSDVQSFLEQRDFEVVDAVNPSDLDPEDDFDTSLEGLTIRHTADGLPRAELLRDRLGDVPVDLEEVDELPEGADVVLVVGSAWEDQA